MEKRKSKLPVIIGIVAAVLFIAGSTFAMVRFVFPVGKKTQGGEPKYPGVYFLQDNELWLSKFGNDKLVMIDDDIFEDEEDYEWFPYYSYGFELTGDNKYILYGRNFTGLYNDGSFDLCCKKADGSGDRIKIDKNVTTFNVLHNNTVLYTDEEGDLYLSDLKESEKVASDLKDARSYYIDPTHEYVMWVDDDGTLYYRDLKLKENKEKIDTDVDGVYTFNDRFQNVVYFKKNGQFTDLYQVRNLEDPEEFAEGVDQFYVSFVGDKVVSYYSKLENEEDAGEYGFIEQTVYYRAEGEEAKEIDSDYIRFGGFFAPEGKTPVLVYSIGDDADDESTFYIARETETFELDIDDAYFIFASGYCYEGMDKLFIVTGERDYSDSERALYTVELSGKNFGKVELVNDDVENVYTTIGGKLCYIAEPDRGDRYYWPSAGTLMLGDNEIADDALVVTSYKQASLDSLLFYTDFDFEGYNGTLNILRGDKSHEIDEDVALGLLLNDKYVAYLSDYNEDKYGGDLYLYDGKKSRLIAEDVMFIITTDELMYYYY